MGKKLLSYNELKKRLALAEAALDSIRKGQVDVILGEKEPLVVRMKSLIEENERLVKEWQTTFDTVPDSIMILDPEQKVLRYNKATLDIFKSTPDEIKGKRCCEVIHGKNKPIEGCPYLQMCKSRRREQFEMTIGVNYYLVTVDPVVNEKGELNSYIHTVTDITERKKIEKRILKNLENLEILLDTSKSLSTFLHLGAILKRAAENSLKISGFDYAAIYLQQEGKLNIEAVAPGKKEEMPPECVTLSAEESPLINKAISTCQTVVFDPETRKMNGADKFLSDHCDLLTGIILPLSDKGKVLGIMINASKKEEVFLSDPDKYYLITLSNITAIAVRNAILYQNSVKAAVDLELALAKEKQAEMALRESEEKFRNLFQKHAAIKLIVDPETAYILEANETAAKFYGWSIDELKQMNISQISTFPPEVLKKRMQEILSWEKTYFESIHRKADGTLADVEIFSSRIELGGKRVLHSIIHDITEKKKAEAQLRLLWGAVENSSVSVMVTDVDGNIKYVNPGFTNITGYSFDEAAGQNPRFLKSGKQSTEFYKNLWDNILAGKTWEGELVNKRKNGEFYWEKAVISPVTDSEGKITHFVAVKEDITEKKKILEELIAAKEKAEESSRLKSAFLANISHEIRTPLNGILGFSELLRNPALDDEEKETYLTMLKESGERMLNTINQIIEVSKIETETISVDFENVNINELVLYLFNFFKPEAEKKGLRFSLINKIPADMVISTDKYKVESVLGNFLKNAIKFTEQGSVELIVERGTEGIIFSVKDTGPSIPSSMHEKIFERFVQVDTSYSRSYEGVGLGLSIAKSYAGLLGGKIRLESEAGKGSTFSLILPVKQTDTITEEAEAVQHKEVITDNRGKTILVAEDDELNYFYLETLLRKNGYNILRAKNGMEAVKMCKGNPEVELVLMDIKMPLLNGHEATRKIREFNPRVPILAQTAFAHDSDRISALESGCNDYISKPFTMNELLEKINELLKKK